MTCAAGALAMTSESALLEMPRRRIPLQGTFFHEVHSAVLDPASQHIYYAAAAEGFGCAVDMRFEGTDTTSPPTTEVAVNAAVALDGRCSSRASRARARRCSPTRSPRALGRPLIDGTSSRRPRRSRACTNRRGGAAARSQLGDGARSRHRQLHQAGTAVGGVRRDAPAVLLIDEIDKADIEFPNDLLHELDRMDSRLRDPRRLRARATGRRHHVEQREGAARRVPASLLLPLHRFPTRETMEAIVDVHSPVKKTPAPEG